MQIICKQLSTLVRLRNYKIKKNIEPAETQNFQSGCIGLAF